jgi:hypothetical protein
LRLIVALTPIRKLELHASHACNLTCESCAHITNSGQGGNISAGEADRQMALWSHRLAPAKLNLLGGEPTINPELSAIVRAARKHFPDTLVQVVTNGFFLGRHPDLPAALAGGGQLVLSQHDTSEAYMVRFRAACEVVRGWQDVKVKIQGSSDTWTRRYDGFGPSMRPLGRGEARAAWLRCPARQGIQLHEGKLWKCPLTAYMPLQVARFEGLREHWQPMLDYVPLDSKATDEELAAFLARQEEATCGLCPDVPPRFTPRNVMIPARELLRTRA